MPCISLPKIPVIELFYSTAALRHDPNFVWFHWGKKMSFGMHGFSFAPNSTVLVISPGIQLRRPDFFSSGYMSCVQRQCMTTTTWVTMGKCRGGSHTSCPGGWCHVMSCHAVLTRFPCFLMVWVVWEPYEWGLMYRGQPSGSAKSTCFPNQWRWQLSYSVCGEQNYRDFNNSSVILGINSQVIAGETFWFQCIEGVRQRLSHRAG